MAQINVEICAGSIRSAIAAAEGGAKRIELCSALSEGGLTPSIGLVKKASEIPGLSVYVLIRPRSGDFLYSSEEIQIMADDVHNAIAAGASGIVIGALTENSDIDTDTCELLIKTARRTNPHCGITFHRAFDVCRDPEQSLETIIALGCDRILTSGCSRTAFEGIPMLKKLVTRAAGRISIMAGGGVSAENAKEIVDSTGVNELHASARSEYQSKMKFRNNEVNMGADGVDEYMLMETNPLKVEAIISELRK